MESLPYSPPESFIMWVVNLFGYIWCLCCYGSWPLNQTVSGRGSNPPLWKTVEGLKQMVNLSPEHTMEEANIFSRTTRAPLLWAKNVLTHQYLNNVLLLDFPKLIYSIYCSFLGCHLHGVGGLKWFSPLWTAVMFRLSLSCTIDYSLPSSIVMRACYIALGSGGICSLWSRVLHGRCSVNMWMRTSWTPVAKVWGSTMLFNLHRAFMRTHWSIYRSIFSHHSKDVRSKCCSFSTKPLWVHI